MANKSISIFLTLAVMALILINSQTHAVHHTDCMKNPFASGCRGISAKRASWSYGGPASADLMPPNYLTDRADDRTLGSRAGQLQQQQQQQQIDGGSQWHQSANLGAAELLLLAANRLLREPFNNQRGE